MKDIILSYGHSPIGGKDTGASAYHSTENVLTRKYLKKNISDGLKRCGITYKNVSEKRIHYTNMYNQWAHGKPSGYKMKMSIHLNATYGATGSLVETTSKNKNSGSELASMMSKALHTNNRGAKLGNLYMLREMEYDYLLEPCFCDTKSDYDKFIKYHVELAEAIVCFICKQLGKKYVVETKKVIKETYPRTKNNLLASKYLKLRVGTVVNVYKETKHWSKTNKGWIFKKRLK